jgi:CPA2 family monovalent cation:H+ antiporter-2
VFVTLMLLFGARVVPWFLLRIAHTRSRELFLLVVLTVALGTALGAAALFGVSLALGAFLAGIVVNESPLSHQVGADVLPFREAFAVLFFVSVGMLVDPRQLLSDAGSVAALTAVIVVGKSLAALVLAALLAQPLRTGLVVAAGLSQIGEFSFILGQAGMKLQMLSPDQYSLLLAGALVSITVNPLMFRAIGPAERTLRRSPRLRRWLDRGPVAEPPREPAKHGHVVIVGCGRVGAHIVGVLGRVGVERLVIDADPDKIGELTRQGVSVLFGDAANSEVLVHAGLERARALAVTIPDEAAAALVVAGAHTLAPELPIVARAATQAGVKHLAELGAQDVIHPELEGSLEIIRHTLLHLGFPLREVQKYADVVRRESYDPAIDRDQEHHALLRLMDATRELEIGWVVLPEASALAGRTLAEAGVRARTGASVVAIQRKGSLVPNPGPETRLEAGDRIGLIGEPGQLELAESLLSATRVSDRPPDL